LTLANWITLSRLVLAIPVFYLFLQGDRLLAQAIILGFVAGLTDIIDGWAARARNEVSELGKLLDPLADKVLILAVLLAFTLARGLPGWLVWTYLAKELLQIAGGALLYRQKGGVISANKWGKAGTFGFLMGFLLYLFHPLSGLVLIIVALGVSIYALASYFREFIRMK
jgi:cardiolipin synthase